MSTNADGPSYGALPPLPDLRGIDLNKIGRGKSNGPEYILYNKRGRDFWGRLSFNTGVFWLGGFTLGGGYGFVEGWRNAASPNMKIRFNSVMNGVSRRGAIMGSSLGIIAFMHTSNIALADYLELEHRTGSAVVPHAFAGLLTGAVYSSTTGPRAAALASVIGVTISCAYGLGGNYLYNVVLGGGGRY